MRCGLQVLCAAGGDSDALLWHSNTPSPSTEPAAAAARDDDSHMATDENPHPDEEPSAAPAGAGEGAGASGGDAQYPADVRVQHGWLPGLGEGGVVLEWSHAAPDAQKLEVMLCNAISILDTMTTLSTAHAGIRAMHSRVCHHICGICLQCSESLPEHALDTWLASVHQFLPTSHQLMGNIIDPLLPCPPGASTTTGRWLVARIMIVMLLNTSA